MAGEPNYDKRAYYVALALGIPTLSIQILDSKTMQEWAPTLSAALTPWLWWLWRGFAVALVVALWRYGRKRERVREIGWDWFEKALPLPKKRIPEPVRQMTVIMPEPPTQPLMVLPSPGPVELPIQFYEARQVAIVISDHTTEGAMSAELDSHVEKGMMANVLVFESVGYDQDAEITDVKAIIEYRSTHWQTIRCDFGVWLNQQREIDFLAGHTHYLVFNLFHPNGNGNLDVLAMTDNRDGRYPQHSYIWYETFNVFQWESATVTLVDGKGRRKAFGFHMGTNAQILPVPVPT